MCECYLWVGVTYFSSVEDDKCEDKSHRKRAFLSKVFISMFGGSFFLFTTNGLIYFSVWYSDFFVSFELNSHRKAY